MDDQDTGKLPESDLSPEPTEVILVSPRTSSQRGNPSAKDGTIKEVARELHLWEKINIAGQLSLVVVGIFAAGIYGCQLHTMNAQLGEMKGSGEQTNKLLCLYQRQLNQLTNQANNTHDLAKAAKAQSVATRTIADNAVTQAIQTTKLANSSDSQARIAQQNFDIDNRPYIGFSDFPFTLDATRHIIGVGVLLSNSGKIPAKDMDFGCQYVEGTEVFMKPLQDRGKRELPPQTNASSTWKIGPPYSDLILAGQMPLTVFCHANYKWRNETEEKCNKRIFDPLNKIFFDLGDLCAPSTNGGK